MINKTLLCLDLSTTSTGYALFDLNTKKLLTYGFLKPISKGLSKLKYPKQQIFKIRNLVYKILDLLETHKPDIILIEEINRHKSRLSGKTLDMLHGLLLDAITEPELDRVIYIDSDGLVGWRTKLRLVLDNQDKVLNKERRILNKKTKKQHPIINKKHLACRYVNKALNLNFDVDLNPNDNDIVDAIGMGLAFLKRI